MSETKWIYTVINSIAEIHRLMPDSILFGSILLYFLTQNVAFGVFSVFIFETVGTHKLISWMFSQAVGEPTGSKPIPPSGAEYSTMIKSRMGYKTPRYDYKRMFSHSQYPSYGVFSIVAIGAYLAMAMNEFSDTFKELDLADAEKIAQWKSRPIVAYSLIAIVSLVTIIVHCFLDDEPVGEIVIALTCALITGILFFYINMSLFGRDSMNFLGIPTMSPLNGPVYICAQ